MDVLGLGDGTAEDFFVTEFCDLAIRDKRLKLRAIKLFQALQKRLTICVRRLFFDAKDSRQAYDFFSNPKVSGEVLLEPHYQNTIERVRKSKAEYILTIQDTTVLNYTSHLAKTSIGRIGLTGKTHQYGLFQHNTLCVSSDNEALGLIDLQHFHNDDFDTSIDSDNRPIEEKKTICWINALKATREKLKGCGKKIITVADRDGDFFEFLHELADDLYVIRAQYDRYTGAKYKKGDKLIELLDKTDPIGDAEIIINDVETHEIKTITLKIKKLQAIAIPPSSRIKRANKEKHYHPIKVNVVMAYSEVYCWTLITNLPVESLEECLRVLKIYKERWHVEDFHKVLKTGYQVDELYLHASLSAIKNALVMASISACRLYWLIFSGRVEQELKADKFFKEYEWKSLYIYFKEPIPKEIPTLVEVIHKIARLGGYKPTKKSKPPGVKTMWLGFQAFSVAAEMYHSILSIKT